jgi:hypothetical protein
MPSATTSNALYRIQMEKLLMGATAFGIFDSFTEFRIALYTSSKPGLDYVPNAITITGGTSVSTDTSDQGTEVSTSSTGYSRVSYQKGASYWNFAGDMTGGSSTLEYNNSQAITFGVPTANWGAINHLVLYGWNGSQDTSYVMLFTASLSSAKTVNNGDGAPKILANQLKISRAYC